MVHVITAFRNGYDIGQRHVLCDVGIRNDTWSKPFKQLLLCHFKIRATIPPITLTKMNYSFFFTRECQRKAECSIY